MSYGIYTLETKGKRQKERCPTIQIQSAAKLAELINPFFWYHVVFLVSV